MVVGKFHHCEALLDLICQLNVQEAGAEKACQHDRDSRRRQLERIFVSHDFDAQENYERELGYNQEMKLGVDHDSLVGPRVLDVFQLLFFWAQNLLLLDSVQG